MLGLNYCVGLLLNCSVKCCVFAHFVCLEGAYVSPVLMVTRECTREGRVCCCSIKYIVGVRHALFAPQRYDARVHVHT